MILDNVLSVVNRKNLPVLLVGGAVLLFLVLVGAWSPVKAIAVMAAGLACIATFRRPEATILFLAAYIPLEPFLLKFVSDDLYVYARYFSEVLIYVLCAVSAWRLVLHRARMPQGRVIGLLGALSLVMIVSWIYNVTPVSVAVLGIRQIIRFILLFLAVLVLQPSQRFMQRVLVTVGLVAGFEAVLALAQVVIGSTLDEILLPSQRHFFEDVQLTTGTAQFWESGQRVFGTLGRYDQLGNFLCFVLLFLLAAWYELRSKISWRWFAAAGVLGGAALVMTYSRAAWFGCILGVGLISLMIKRDRWVMGLVGVGLIAIGGYIAYFSAILPYLIDQPSQTIVERFFEAFSPARWRGEYDGLGRVYFLVNTPLKVVASSPLVGVGPGSFGGGAAAALHYTAVYDRLQLPFGIYGTEGHIDNNWFSLWGELGTVGVGLYVLILMSLGRIAYHLYRRSKDAFDRMLGLGFLGFLIALTLQGFVATNFEVRTLALFFWLAAAFVAVRYEATRSDVSRDLGEKHKIKTQRQASLSAAHVHAKV